MTSAGSLVCVGIGMTLGSHLTPLSRSYIEQSDVLFAGTSDGLFARPPHKAIAQARKESQT